MSLQARFNKEAIGLLPEIKKLLVEANSFSYSQIYCYTIREVLNSPMSISYMSKKQIKKFEDKLIQEFKYYNWI